MIKTNCWAVLFFVVFGWQVCNAEVIVRQVTQSSDDAEEHLTEGPGNMDLTSTDLELGAEGGAGDVQAIGIRFQNFDVAAGSIIQNAFIQFTVDETDTEDTSVRIYGELSLNPLTYSDANLDITSRTSTNNFVDWNNIPLWDTEGVAGPDQRTPDLSILVQEIIDQPGWTADSAIAFIIAPNPGGERTGESFDGASDSGNLALAPQLNVTFVPEPSTITFFTMAGLVGAFVAWRKRKRA